MISEEFDVNKLKVASPCHVGWENMHGDERVRRCDSCELNVFNIAELTAKEVDRLIATREGRLCIRLYRRADGTVITKDCPVGLRAYQKRVVRFAGTALAMMLGLFSVGFGQKKMEKRIDASKVGMVRTKNYSKESEVTGTVVDQYGAVIPGVEVSLVGGKRETKVKSNDDGIYYMPRLLPGSYRLTVISKGFRAYEITNLRIGEQERILLTVRLEVTGEVVGFLLTDESPLIDLGSTSITTTITRRQIEKLPY